MKINQFLGFLILAAIVGLPFPVKAADTTAANKVVNIGFILPLTGDAASIGQAMQKAAQLAYDKLPKDTQGKIKLFFEDDGMQAKNTLSAFGRLSAESNIDVVINASSGTGNALAPIAEMKKVPFVAIASDPKIVNGRRYVVNLWVTPESEMQVLMPEVERRGYKRIVRVSTIHDFTLLIKKSFDSYNLHSDGTTPVVNVVLDEEYPPDTRDFKTLVAKIKGLSNIDAVLPILMPGQLSEFSRQLRQAQVATPLFGFEFFEDSNEVKLSKGALVGAWYVNASDATSEFLNDFTKLYPDASLFGAANAYDAVNLVARAVELGKVSREELNDFLHEVKNFKGALGTYSATADNRFSLPAAIKLVKSDGFEQVS